MYRAGSAFSVDGSSSEVMDVGGEGHNNNKQQQQDEDKGKQQKQQMQQQQQPQQTQQQQQQQTQQQQQEKERKKESGRLNRDRSGSLLSVKSFSRLNLGSLLRLPPSPRTPDVLKRMGSGRKAKLKKSHSVTSTPSSHRKEYNDQFCDDSISVSSLRSDGAKTDGEISTVNGDGGDKYGDGGDRGVSGVSAALDITPMTSADLRKSFK
ncbi:hypothetical protein Pmani_024517 [Petrolisthes manimaculis]|uniref:Uncharacterized protein n=1 Tax=Petrolisthes manimaculis TaxID=1843537 RepID=A0AAE1P9L7_9EUCA|nr:hypothetical protein Pmani_024517 [Petrolisthes manimaculis]